MDYKNKDFDDAMARGLSDSTNGQNPDWADFARRLYAADQTPADQPDDAAFDAAVAAGLSRVGENLPPDWSDFDDKMGNADEPFDAVIAAGLAGLTAESTGNWSAFSELLDEAEGEAFDTAARDKIGDLHTPYDPADWETMRARIREEFSLRRRLIRYKVAEVGLMLLFVFTIFNLFGPQIGQRINAAKNNAGAIEVQEIETAVPIAIVESTVKNRVDSPENTDARIGNVVKADAAGVADEEASPLANVVVDKLEDTDLPNVNYVGTGDVVPIFAAPLVDVSPVLESEMPDAVVMDRKIPLLAVEDREEVPTTATSEQRMRDFVLEALGVRKPTAPESQNTTESLLQASNFSYPHKNLRLGMFTAAQLYGVYSPYDRFFNYRPDVAYGVDMGGGLLFDFQKDRFHLVTGGAYTPKYFNPQIKNEVIGSFATGYLREQLERIQLDILHLPLEVRYDFLQRPKWRVYGAGGASFNFVLSNSFIITEEVSEDTDLAAIGSLRQENSNLSRKDFTGGVVEGGRLPENTLVTLQFGFGVERFVSDRWSIFFEPIYQHQLSRTGIGPNDNSFRTLSLRLGAKATVFGR